MNKRLSREELIKIVTILTNGGYDEETGTDYSEREIERLVNIFEDNVPHPRAVDLIFNPDEVDFTDDATPEEIVDFALSYKENK